MCLAGLTSFRSSELPCAVHPWILEQGRRFARAKVLRSLGREGSGILLVRLTCCEPMIGYRRLEVYAKRCRLQGRGADDTGQQGADHLRAFHKMRHCRGASGF
jgi:hypothetical protein